MTIIKPTIVLLIVAFISAFALSHVNRITYPAILKQEQEKQKNALSIVLPGFKIGKKRTIKIDGRDIQFWKGEKSIKEIIDDDSSKKKKKKKKKKEELKDKVITGYAFLTSMPGYSGDIKSIVGINENGSMIGISILEQTETPGLGSRCTEIASKNTFFGFLFGSGRVVGDVKTPWFQEQFNGLNINRKIRILKKGDYKPEMKALLLKKNAISAITGATITSRAVVKSLKIGNALLKRLKQEMKEKTLSDKEKSK